MVTACGSVAALVSPTCQKMPLPVHVAGGTSGATTMPPGAMVRAPTTLKIHGPAPVSVSVVFSVASPGKQ